MAQFVEELIKDEELQRQIGEIEPGMKISFPSYRMAECFADLKAVLRGGEVPFPLLIKTRFAVTELNKLAHIFFILKD